MGLVDQVTGILQNIPRVVLLKGPNAMLEHPTPHADREVIERVEYHIAPYQSLYTPEELNGFIAGILPELPLGTTSHDFFIGNLPRFQSTGVLFKGGFILHERVGERKITTRVTLDDPSVRQRFQGFPPEGSVMETVVTRDLARIILIGVLPDAHWGQEYLARNIWHMKHQYLSPGDYDKYRLCGQGL